MKLSPELAAACLKLAAAGAPRRPATMAATVRTAGPWAITITAPIAVRSRANLRLHWAESRRMNKIEATAVGAALARLGLTHAGRHLPRPLAVRLTRLHRGRDMDDDNLAGAHKAVRDALANDWLGIDDGSPLVRWAYAQERAAVPACRIEVTGIPIEEV